MKKILILSNCFGGLYNFRKMLIQELLDQGNKVYLASPKDGYEKYFEEMGCPCYELMIERRGMNPLKDGKLFISVVKLLKKVKPDLVITYTIKPNIYGGMACRIKRIPYATNITGLGTAFLNEGILKKIVVMLYRTALKQAKVVFFENSGNKQTMLENRIVKEEQTCVLNGAGVDLEKYPYCKYPTDEAIRLLFIGRVMKEKGVDELFEVAKRIKKEYTNVYFDIIGPLEDDYKDKIQDLSGKGVIEYHGYQKNVNPFIEKCHCFVLPSYHEGMANVLLEAGAIGRPLITSRIHGCMEAVNEDENGYLSKAKDTEELYKNIKKFIELSHSEKEEMGRKSRQIMEMTFDKKLVVEHTLKEI